MKTMIIQTKKVKFKNPILIEGLPGIGNVGRVAAGYLVSELKMEKFAECYSSHFLPLVVLHPDNVAHALKCEFFYYRGKKSDVIILTGDTQSITSEGHYQFSDVVLDFAQKLGVKTVITLGGFAEGAEVKEPRVIGAVNDKKLIKYYEKYGLNFNKEHSIGTIVGASGLLIGLAKLRNIDGLCLLGQTMGFPLITDPKAADKVLQILSEILGIKIDLSKLEKIIKDLEGKIKKSEQMHREMFEQMRPKSEDIKYIG